MRAFIEANFKMMDLNGDGVIGVEEFRYNCIQRLATDDIKVVDDAFNQLLNVSSKQEAFPLCMTIINLPLPRPSINWKSFPRRTPSRNLIFKFLH